MKKKLLFISIIFGIFLLVIARHDPIRLLTDFVIAGIVPGVDISLGFFPCIAVIIGLLAIVKRAVKHIDHELLRDTAEMIQKEAAEQELQSKTAVNTSKQRSVIKAPTLLDTSTST